MDTNMRGAIDAMSKNAADKGKLIEAGWLALKLVAIPATASETQIKEMRKAFFAGAQHLFASIMGILEDGHEATENDLNRLTQIDSELRHFVSELKEETML